MSRRAPAPTPVPWMLVAVFGVSLVVGIGLLRIVQGMVAQPDALIEAAMLAPAFAALVTWLCGRVALPGLMPAAVSRRQFVAHTVLGIAAATLFALITWIIGSALGAAGIYRDDVPVPLVVLGSLVAALAFELGMRGVLQPMLETRIPRVLAALLIGLVWGIAYLPSVSDPVAVAPFLITTVSLSVLLGYLGNGAWWQRWLTAAIVHWLVMVATLLIVGASWQSTPHYSAVAMGAACTAGLFLAMFIVAQRRRAARAAA